MVTKICGVGRGFKHGKCLSEAAFDNLRAICVDPINPGCYFVGDQSSIRYCTPEAVCLIAGEWTRGFADRRGQTAQFNFIFGLVCTRDRKTLYASDHLNHRIRSIDTTSGTVSTLIGDGTNSAADGFVPYATLSAPLKLCFDRSHTALFITSTTAIRRFEFESERLTTLWPPSDLAFRFIPCGIAVTGSGRLIVGSMDGGAVCSFDPITRKLELLVGTGTGSDRRAAQKSAADDLVVVEHERCTYVTDSRNSCVLRITLPDSLF